MSIAKPRTVLVVLSSMVLLTSCATTSRDESPRAHPPTASQSAEHPRWHGIWTARAAAFPTAMAVDEQGIVTVGEDGGVVAMDPEGALEWAVVTGDGPITHPPALVDDVAVVPTATQLVAVDRADGTSRWIAPIADARVEGGHLSPADAGVVLVAAVDGSLTLLDSASGAARWATTLPAPVPDVVPDVWLDGASAVVAWGAPGDCCHLAGIDPALGSLRWTEIVTASSTVPVVHDGLVLVAENPPNDERRAEIVAWDAETGTLAWRTEARGLYSPGLHGAAAGHDAVFVDQSGAVTLVDTETGSVRWRSRPVYPQDDAQPNIAGNRVFLTAFETIGLGFDRRTGELIGKGPYSPPVFVRHETTLDDRLLMLVTTNGTGAVWVFGRR